MSPESSSVRPSGREAGVSGSGRAQHPGARPPRSQLCREADAVRAGTQRPSLWSRRWQLRHWEPSGIREKVCGAAAPLGPAGGPPRVLPTSMSCPGPRVAWPACFQEGMAAGQGGTGPGLPAELGAAWLASDAMRDFTLCPGHRGPIQRLAVGSGDKGQAGVLYF